MIKIKKIEFNNHKIFGNKVFDFTINDNIANTIVIIGNNGCGKTNLLKEINKLNGQFYHLLPLKEYSVKITICLPDNKYFDKRTNQHLTTAEFYISDNGSKSFRFLPDVNKARMIVDNNENDINFLDLECIFSEADLPFKTSNKVNGITNKTIDNTKNDSNILDIAYDITQLFVDISSQDNADFKDYAIEKLNNDGYTYFKPDEAPSRMSRFKNAFKYIFENKLTFSKIENNSIPIFKKGESTFPISSLSAGEKQVVFRGGFLLKNKNSLKGALVLIDEPEISMHPSWEKRIFGYYKSLFTEDSCQTSQIFFATHSEYVLEEAIDTKDCLILDISKDNTEKYYKGSGKYVFPRLLFEECRGSIFDIHTVEYHILLYAELQILFQRGQNGKAQTIKKFDDWLINQSPNCPKKHYVFGTSNYYALPTYIRNCIDHPDSGNQYKKEELAYSIQYMISLLKQLNSQNSSSN